MDIQILGRESILITGREGSGKSHFLMQNIYAILQTDFKNTIYLSNVKGVAIDDPRLKIVDPDFDWTTASENDIVIYDEAGTIDRFSNMQNKLHTDELKMISQRRKTGILLIFVAQDPLMINSSMRKLLKFHFHFSNPYNDKEKTHCFVFAGVNTRLTDDNKSWHNSAIEQFTHVLDPVIFPLYKSIDENANHNKTKVTNKKAKKLFIISAIAAPIAIILMGLVIWSAYGWYKNNLDSKKVNEKVNHVKNGGVASAVAGTATALTQTHSASTVAAMGGNDIQLQQNNANAKRQIELYNQLLPNDYQIYANNSDLRVSGVVAIAGDCRAYNQHGDILDISVKDCLTYTKKHSKMIHARSQNTVITDNGQNQVAQSQPQNESQAITPADTMPKT